MGKFGHYPVTPQAYIGVSNWGMWAGSAGFDSFLGFCILTPTPFSRQPYSD